MIPEINMEALVAREPSEMAKLEHAVREIGFLTLGHTAVRANEISEVIEAYRQFFKQPAESKAKVDMARTGSNRGGARQLRNRWTLRLIPTSRKSLIAGMNYPLDIRSQRRGFRFTRRTAGRMSRLGFAR